MSGFAPLAHGCAIFGFSAMMKQSGMPYYIGEGLLLILGAMFYTVSDDFRAVIQNGVSSAKYQRHV